MKLLQRTARPLVCLGLLSASTWCFGAVQAPAPVPQITQAVNNQQRVTLKGNMRPVSKRAQDLGPVDAGAPASRVLLLLKRPAEQEAALQQFIAEVHSPGTASYHHWLTPAQLGGQFGPADSDVQAVVAWLQSQGFAVAKVSQAKTTIEFSGTAGQIESAFATKIHSFQLDGVTHIANIVDPQIPAALAPVIAGISPLNDFRPKPMHTVPLSRSATPAPTSANPRAMSIQPAGNQPNLTVPKSSGTGNDYFLTPADVATIYNTPNSALNKNHTGSLNLTGSGVTIGIAGDSNVDLSNVANYRSLFGLPAHTPTVTIDGSDPGTGSGDEVEALLDLEVASAVAPDAALNLYISQDTTFQSGLFLAIQRALDDDAVNILNVSFGGCEAAQGQSGNQEILNFWEQAAAQGISVTVSTGDSGSAGCDDANTEPQATVGLQVNGLASTPYNIAVGGTDFNQNSTNEATYWSPTNSTIGESALGPIPEIPWDDSTSTIGALAGNVPATYSGSTSIAAAGGGVSGCLNPVLDPTTGALISCTNTNSAYPKPSFQSSFGTLNARELPDVSLFAADGVHDSAWVLCASGIGADSASDVDCLPSSPGAAFNFQIVGGTSAASPAFAGMLSLVVQQLESGGATNVRLGQADYTIYALATQFPASFHDVTTGNNSVVCASGSLNCGTNGFLTGYNAASGYDPATGLGSVDATQLVQNWSKIAFKASTTALQLNGATAPISIQHGTPVTVAASVTGSGGTPTGNLALVTTSTAPGSAASAVQFTQPSPSVFALTNGTVTGTDAYLPGSGSTPYTVTANYGGDGAFSPSKSNGITVTVSPEPSTLQLGVLDFLPNGQGNDASTATAPSLPYGTWISVSAQPLSTAQVNTNPQPAYFSQATGSVTFTSTSSLLNKTVPINSNGLAEIPGQTTLAYPPGSYTVSASYPGDPSFGASSAPSQSFKIVQSTTTVKASNGSAAGTVLVEVDPVFSGALLINSGVHLPTGTVTLTNSAGASVGSGALAVVNTANGQAAQATITVSGTAATVNYPGDTNYTASSAAFSGGGGALFSLSATPTTIPVPSGGSATTTISVTPAAGFTGTVSVACAVTGSGSPAPTCSLAQPSVAITSAKAGTDVLTVTTVSASAAVHIADSADRTWYAGGGIALAGILLFGLPGRRRAWQRMLSLMLLIIAAGVVGCGGTSSSGGGGGGSGTPAGSYTVTVTATSGTATQTSTITATVQ
ncbi:MAG TPA: protease pro-enzyme activation domain-containing protein [Acidobacteriaceae bacterium]